MQYSHSTLIGGLKCNCECFTLEYGHVRKMDVFHSWQNVNSYMQRDHSINLYKYGLYCVKASSQNNMKFQRRR